MGTEVMINKNFVGKAPAKGFEDLNPASESLADGIGQSYGIIGYKGKVWSLRYRGEKHTFVRPDDGTPSSYIDVVILQQAKLKSKSYYEKYDPSQSDGARPICSSVDGIVPDADVVNKQCDTCALCPRNEWKQGANGRKERECTDYKRLAVLLMPVQTKAILNGEALMEPVFLRVPPASLQNLAMMGEQMNGQGWHFSTYITRIGFDPAEAHPKMVFTALQGLTEAEVPVVKPLRADPQALRIIGEDVKRTAITGPAPMKQIAAPAAPAPKVENPAVPLSTSTGIVPSSSPAPQSVTAGPVTPPATNSAPTVDTSLTDTGLTGSVTTASPSEPKVAEVTPQTVADVGEAEASDAELDARIAAIMGK